MSNKENSIPDMDVLLNAIKSIKRAVPAVKDGDYSYFADSINMGSTIADDVNSQITEALTQLPTSLEQLLSVDSFAQGIAKINAAEEAGTVDADTASAGRKQLQDRLNEGVTTVVVSFDNSASDLSGSGDRLKNYSNKNEVRLKDANQTETANHDRAKADKEREGARVDVLQSRYDKLSEAVDEKRGGPVDELLEILPDEDELSDLLDLAGSGSGSEDPAEGAAEAATAAAAPEAAAAKKAIELAVKQIKKILGVINKIVEFQQLVDIRDQVFKALQAQRTVSNEAAARLRKANETIGQLALIQKASDSMNSVSTEVNKMTNTFTDFTQQIKNLDGSQIGEDTISTLYKSMKAYLEQSIKAKNSVILG